MIIKAGFVGDIPAFPRRIDRIEEVDGLIGIRRVRERAEIEVAFVVGPSGDLEIGIIPLHGDIRIMGIVHHHDVVAG
jgi:hypothetical protein